MSLAVDLALRSATMPFRRRAQFIGAVLAIVGGANVRALYMPQAGEGTTVKDAYSSRVWTHANTPNGRYSRLGNGWALAFNGTSDYLSTPDATDLTFAEPAVVSFFGVANVVDTATNRSMFTKSNTGETEYIWNIGTADQLKLFLQDTLGVVTITRTSDPTAPQGSWASYGTSYAGTGGASAADGASNYVNGSLVASTSANSAGYTAMSDKPAAGIIGAQNAGTANFFSGSMAMVLLVAANLSATQHAQLTQLARTYFGLS